MEKKTSQWVQLFLFKEFPTMATATQHVRPSLAARMLSYLSLKGQISEMKKAERNHYRELVDLKWQNAVLAESLEAVLESRPHHVQGEEVRKHCGHWPNCNHACGEGLSRAHKIAESGLKDAFGARYVEKLKAGILRQAAADLPDDVGDD